MHPYILIPRWARLSQRVLFLARYGLLGVAGLIALVTPIPSLYVIGWVLLLAAGSAVIGVSTGRFHFELVAIWFILAALIWAMGVLYAAERNASATLVLALVPALGERLLHLLLVASKARRLTGAADDGSD